MPNVRDIRIAIVGLGNCASSLVQGISYYRRNPAATHGLMHPTLGGYAVGDIHIACAFDVDQRKLGRRVAEAIFAPPNNTTVFCPDPDDDGAIVYPGPIGDGVAGHMKNFDESKRTSVSDSTSQATLDDVVAVLKKSGVHVLVNYLPVGSMEATKLYATACLRAKVAMVNCIPVFIASDAAWERQFKDAGLPIVGDDVKSQFGATIIHRLLITLAEARGIAIDNTYQLNVGGNTDFLNMLERGRLASKKVSKTEAVTSQTEQKLDDSNVHIGPSDYISFLKDNKVCYIRVNARGFGGLPMEVDLKLSVEDSPNSAGVVVDAVRAVRLAQVAGVSGNINAVSAALMKHPLTQMRDPDAAAAMEAWVTQHASASEPPTA